MGWERGAGCQYIREERGRSIPYRFVNAFSQSFLEQCGVGYHLEPEPS